jgi:4-nitrophenyl phosphatase
LIDKLAPPVRGLILDMDGVLWKDDEPLGDLPAIFRHFHRLGLKVVLATNNATKTVDEYLAKLNQFGVVLDPLQIVTSSIATAHVLEKTFPQKGAVFVVGENGILSALKDTGFSASNDPNEAVRPVAVIASIDRSISYPKLRWATLLIRSGVPFYGTNPDKTFPTPAGLVPGAGSILAAIETATGIKPVIIGKPAPYMLEQSAERMGLTKDEVLVVGDRLETDIEGGQSMRARTALVLSGVSTSTEAQAWRPRPDLVAKNLSELIGI